MFHLWVVAFDPLKTSCHSSRNLEMSYNLTTLFLSCLTYLYQHQHLFRNSILRPHPRPTVSGTVGVAPVGLNRPYK